MFFFNVNKFSPKLISSSTKNTEFWCYKNSLQEKAKEIFGYKFDDLDFFDFVRPQRYRYGKNAYITLSNPDSSFGSGKFERRFGDRQRWVLRCTAENELNVSMTYQANKEGMFFYLLYFSTVFLILNKIIKE